MNPFFLAFWIVWRAAFVLAVAVESLLPTYVWPLLFGAFLTVEAIGVAREEKGDTASETHWAVGSKGVAWRLWSVGFAGAYVWQLWRLPALLGAESSVAWGFICVGMFGWLSAHFFFLGRHG